MTASPRLALPFLVPGQAQKEMMHNEALLCLDIAAQPCAESAGMNVPPADPVPGNCWIIGPAPEGLWTGKSQQLCGWTENGWRFVQPFRGLNVWIIDEGMFARWNGEAWVMGVVSATAVEIGGVQVLGPRQPAISDPAGGTIVDVETRAVIGSILTALRIHGLIDDSI